MSVRPSDFLLGNGLAAGLVPPPGFLLGNGLAAASDILWGNWVAAVWVPPSDFLLGRGLGAGLVLLSASLLGHGLAAGPVPTSDAVWGSERTHVFSPQLA